MTDVHDNARDEVLFAFQLAHPRPGPADIADWVERHPELRDDLLEHAALLLEAAHDGETDDPATEQMLARGRSVTLDLAFRAEQSARAANAGAVGPTASFEDLMQASGKSVPALARELDVGRGVLSDLVSGRMAPPVGRRLAEAVTRALDVPVSMFVAAFEHALATPILGRAKASGAPEAKRRSYAEIVSDDPAMSKERKTYWLEE